jgi:alcohol dehydrogenase
MATNPGSISDYIGLFTIRNQLPPLIAVTTTSGTGSEVSYAAVIVDPNRYTKMVIADPKLIPIIAVNDPTLCRTMPPHITAGTGMDALTHAVEAYISTLANPLSDGLALQGIALIAENLPRAVEDGEDMDARTNMCYGQYFAALAFNGANLGNTHSVAHALGARYGLPHGDLNAIVLPHVLRKNKSECAAKLANIAKTMGVDITGLSTEEAADRAIQAIESMSQRIGIASTLTDLFNRHKKTADRGDIPGIVGHAIQDPCGASNPVVFTREDFVEVCENAWQ